MKALRDPEVESLTSWFMQTHEVHQDPLSGRASWRRFASPMGGGAGDQDSRLMAGLDLMRREHNGVLAAEMAQAERERANAPKRMQDE